MRVKFIDWFAGIGGFRRGMELAGHECVGFCEFDKFATASYISMHLLTDEQRKKLDELPQKKRQKEILKDEYRNGEWYANDVRRVCADDIPKADCWCFGFPCQDISVAGKQLGFRGNRSSLFFRVMYLIGQLKEEDKPTYLFIENVKNSLRNNCSIRHSRMDIEILLIYLPQRFSFRSCRLILYTGKSYFHQSEIHPQGFYRRYNSCH